MSRMQMIQCLANIMSIVCTQQLPEPSHPIIKSICHITLSCIIIDCMELSRFHFCQRLPDVLMPATRPRSLSLTTATSMITLNRSLKHCQHSISQRAALRGTLLIQSRLVATMTRPRRFKPLNGKDSQEDDGSATELKGIIFDMDGTLCTSTSPSGSIGHTSNS